MSNFLNRIKAITEELTGIEDISTFKKPFDTVCARFLYYALCRYYSNKHKYVSLGKIGKCINRDHSTVIYGLKKYDVLAEYNDFPYIKEYKKGVSIIWNMIDESNPYNELIENIYKLDLNDIDLLKLIVDHKLKEYDTKKNRTTTKENKESSIKLRAS